MIPYSVNHSLTRTTTISTSSTNLKPTLVILAAGMGSRYGGLKQLDGVGPDNETILDFSVYDAIRADFGKVVIIARESFVDEFKNRISARFSDLIDVEFVLQPIEPDIPGLGQVPRNKPWGTAHAMLTAKDVISEPFAVLNADDFYGRSSFSEMARFLTEKVSPTHFSMIGFQLENTLSPNGGVSRGICEIDTSHHLTGVIERTKISADGGTIYDHACDPPVELPPHSLVSMNFWGFHPSFFNELEAGFIEFAKANQNNPDTEFYIPTAVNALIQRGSIDVEVLESREQWYGVTYPDDKPILVEAIKNMMDQNLYDNPLWKK